MVIGSGGAGKSVFSRELALRTGLPVIHLDREYWGPAWQPMPEDQWEEKLDLKFLRWIWSYPSTRRPGILRQLAELPESTEVVHLTSRAAIRQFLANVPDLAGAAAGRIS